MRVFSSSQHRSRPEQPSPRDQQDPLITLIAKRGSRVVVYKVPYTIYARYLLWKSNASSFDFMDYWPYMNLEDTNRITIQEIDGFTPHQSAS